MERLRCFSSLAVGDGLGEEMLGNSLDREGGAACTIFPVSQLCKNRFLQGNMY